MPGAAPIPRRDPSHAYPVQVPRAEPHSGRLSDGLMVIALLVMSASAAVYLIGSFVG
jgi:hypothetical protein